MTWPNEDALAERRTFAKRAQTKRDLPEEPSDEEAQRDQDRFDNRHLDRPGPADTPGAVKWS
jgi:hypothetical protein